MKINSIEITAFGKFKNKTISFNDSLNIILGNNESGKSTVISFIYAMLYGFGDNRGKGISMRDKYTPWDGGVCEGKLNMISDNGMPVTIYRKAGNAKKYDILKIYNTDTAEAISITPEDIVKVNSDTFLRTLCIKQLATSFDGGSSEIVTRLANIAQSGDEGASYEKAIKIIEGARREIKPLRGSSGKLTSVNAEIASLERIKAEQQEYEEKLSDIYARIPLAEKNVHKAEADYEKALKINFDAEIANIKGRISEKEAYIEKNKKTPRSKKPYISAAAVFAALGLVMLILSISFWFLPIIGAVAISLFAFIEKEITHDTTETDELQKLQNELICKEKEKAAHESIVAAAKINAISARKNLEILNIQKSSFESKITVADTSSLSSLYKKREELESDYCALTLAFDALESSHAQMKRNFTPQLNKKASQYFKTLTENKYEKIFCDTDFNLCIEADMPRESDFFSGGTVDQLYLSLRLALIDMLIGEESTFLLLDQPFLQYDALRTQKAIELFTALTKNRQIILFTANEKDFSANKNTQILT